MDPDIANRRCYVNQMKRNYIQRLAVNMKDGDGVAKLVRQFEKRLTDNISFIPTLYNCDQCLFSDQ